MLSPNEINHIALLARLQLSAEERDQLGLDLSRILGYIDQLQAMDGGDEFAVEESAARLRPDQCADGLSAEAFLSNAPKTLDRFLLVPAIK